MQQKKYLENNLLFIIDTLILIIYISSLIIIFVTAQ